MKKCRNKNCNKSFNPFKSTDMFCSYKCASTYDKKLKQTPINTPIEKRIEYANRMRLNAFKKQKSNPKKIVKNDFDKEFDKAKQIVVTIVIKKYGKLVCERCGVDHSIQFSVHHIIFRSEKPKHKELNNVRNLIHLCFDCHDGYFHKQSKSVRNYLIEERKLYELFGRIWGFENYPKSFVE